MRVWYLVEVLADTEEKRKWKQLDQTLGQSATDLYNRRRRCPEESTGLGQESFAWGTIVSVMNILSSLYPIG